MHTFILKKNNNNKFPTLSFNCCNNFCDLKASDYLTINCDIQNESTSSIQCFALQFSDRLVIMMDGQGLLYTAQNKGKVNLKKSINKYTDSVQISSLFFSIKIHTVPWCSSMSRSRTILTPRTSIHGFLFSSLESDISYCTVRSHRSVLLCAGIRTLLGN